MDNTTNAIIYNASEYLSVAGTAEYESPLITFQTSSHNNKRGYSPQLVFKYIKSKLTVLERMTIDRRLKRLENAFNTAVSNGQEMLGLKFLNEIAKNTRETVLYARGIRHCISIDDLHRHKRNIRDGHISDTLFKNYTKVIPKDVIAKKKKLEECFDDFVIYHYYNAEIEAKIDKKQKRSESEKAAMRDPILFGKIKEAPDKLYFIADWEDEFCDLTFDELIGVVADETLTKEIKLQV